MKTVFEACQVRANLGAGLMNDSRLEVVNLESARGADKDPTAFLESTFMTSGLSRLLNAALGRLTAGGSSQEPAVIRLEGAFGAGKSHCLAVLFHAAQSQLNLGALPAHRFVAPSRESVRIAAISASDLVSGARHPDVTTSTLWGEIAYQLGGKPRYDQIAESDQRSEPVPTRDDWQTIVGDDPTLIVIDEVEGYFTRVGSSHKAAVRAIASLAAYFASRQRAVLVLAHATFEGQTGNASKALWRTLHGMCVNAEWRDCVITLDPVDELSAIGRRQLFQTVDLSNAEPAARAYRGEFQRVINAGEDLPSKATSDAYATLIEANYPFHPELLSFLSAFRRTPRSALRLLAAAVSVLWERRPDNCALIHPQHLDLGSKEIEGILFDFQADLLLRRVLESDVVSPDPRRPSHADAIDATLAVEGRAQYARQLATAIFLHSLSEDPPAGVARADLLLEVIQPGSDLNAMRLALSRLEETCWFLNVEHGRYRFTTTPHADRIPLSQAGLPLASVQAADGPDGDSLRGGKYIVSFSMARVAGVDSPSVSAEVSDLPGLVWAAAHQEILYDGLAHMLVKQVGFEDLLDQVPAHFRGTPHERLIEVLATEDPRVFLERTLGSAGIKALARRLELSPKADERTPLEQILAHFGFAPPTSSDLQGLAQVVQQIRRSATSMQKARDMADVRGEFIEAAVAIEGYLLLSVRGWARGIFGATGDDHLQTVLGHDRRIDLSRLTFGSIVDLFEGLPDYVAVSPQVIDIERKFGRRHIYLPRNKQTRFSERLRALAEQRNKLAHAKAGRRDPSDMHQTAATCAALLDHASNLFNQMWTARALPRVAIATEQVEDIWGRLRYRLLLDDGSQLEINRSQVLPLGVSALYFDSGTNPRPVDPVFVLLKDLELPNIAPHTRLNR